MRQHAARLGMANDEPCSSDVTIRFLIGVIFDHASERCCQEGTSYSTRALLVIDGRWPAAGLTCRVVKFNGYNQCTHVNTVEDLRWTSILK